MLAVLLALVAANAARLGARPQRRAGHPGLEGRQAGEDSARGVAHVGAVEVEADAARQRLGVVLPEAGVGAGGAALGAVEARPLCTSPARRRPPRRSSGWLEHLLGVGHDEESFLWRTLLRYPPPHS